MVWGFERSDVWSCMTHDDHVPLDLTSMCRPCLIDEIIEGSTIHSDRSSHWAIWDSIFMVLQSIPKTFLRFKSSFWHQSIIVNFSCISWNDDSDSIETCSKFILVLDSGLLKH